MCELSGLDSTAVSTDWVGVGLVLAIAGGFLLATSVVFRSPRELVEESFGAPKRSILPLRDYAFHRVQVHLGFAFLLAGFGVELLGRYQPREEGAAEPEFPVFWAGVVVLAVVALAGLSWWYSARVLRRAVRGHFRRNPPALEADPELARELGLLFGIEGRGDDTVQAYGARVRTAMGLAEPPRGPKKEGLPTRSPEEELV